MHAHEIANETERSSAYLRDLPVRLAPSPFHLRLPFSPLSLALYPYSTLFPFSTVLPSSSPFSFLYVLLLSSLLARLSFSSPLTRLCFRLLSPLSLTWNVYRYSDIIVFYSCHYFIFLGLVLSAQ